MWSQLLIAATIALAAPAPDAFIEVGCPWMPLFFDGATVEIDESGRDRAVGSWAPLMTSGPTAGEVRIVLRTYTTQSWSSARSALSDARAEAARDALVAQGVPPDRIMIGHHAFDRAPNMGPEGWVGGWIFPEFYFTRAAAARMLPAGAMC